MSAAPPVFDGHNDCLLRLWKGGAEGVADRFWQSEAGAIDLARAAEGGFAGGFFAMFPPGQARFDASIFANPPYDSPLPPPLEQGEALRMVVEQAGVALALERAGLLSLCRSAAEIDAALAAGRMAAVLHLEGAEAIDADLLALETLHAAGLRSLGPVWSRPTIFAHGVPFRFPSDGDTGPGLTGAGRRLVARCRELGIVVDTSHMTLRGFWDVAEAGLPLVATHSNAHALSASARNLTDDQLRAVGETGGMVGLNFGTFFLRPDGGIAREGTLGYALDHLEHMLAVAGEDAVGLGSDFDGAPMPPELASVAGLGALRDGMAARGMPPALVAKVCNGNWRAFLRRYWGG